MNPTSNPDPSPTSGTSWWEILDPSAIVSVSAALASIISAAAAVGAIIFQYRLLPRPVWVNASVITFMHPATLTWDLKIVNRGNAAAHDVRVVYDNRLWGGEPVEWHHVEVQPFGAPAIDKHLDFSTMTKDGKTLYDLSEIYVHVYWRQAPKIERIRHMRFHMMTPPRPTYEEGEKWMSQQIAKRRRETGASGERAQ